jgi:predicted ferric reductase
LFLGIILIVFKVLTSYLFKNNPGDTFEVGWHENLRILLNLFNNRVFMKNLGLNFGGLYILVILLFISGRWKKFPDKRLIFLNLAFIPYLLLGFYMIYFTEVRVYTELIPMITTLSIVFISSFEKFKLKPIEQR